MNLWQFSLTGPKVLGPFADFLEDLGHPGAPGTHWLHQKKRWPRKLKQYYY